MTVIVAIKSQTGIVMAADRRVTANDQGWRIPMADKKIGRVGPMLVGVCGDCFPGEVLLELKPPKRNAGESALTYLRKRILPKIRALLPDDRDFDWSALVALDGRLFSIDHLNAVEIEANFWACGAGKEVAIGYLDALWKGAGMSHDACDLAKAAVRVAAKYNTTCGDGCDVDWIRTP